MPGDFPPNGPSDRADGTGGIGTPTPSEARVQIPGGQVFEEMADSPTIERGDQTTITHRFKLDAVSLQTIIATQYRGLRVVDSDGNQSQILSAHANRSAGDMGVLTVVTEGIAPNDDETFNFADSPPDEFDVTEIEINPAIWKHPRYKDLVNLNLDENGEIIDTGTPLNGNLIIQALQQAANHPQPLGRNDPEVMILAQIGADWDEVIVDLAEELLRKLRKGIQTFYLSGWKVSWSTYYFHPPSDFQAGIFLQDPVTEGSLPPIYWSTDETPAGDNILIFASEIVNPNIYGDGIDWLRLADRLQYQRTRFRLTRSWIGGPQGHWDKELYDAEADLPT